MAAVRDGGFKVSVPIMINSADPKSLSIFSFSLSANVIYDERKTPVCINLNVEVNGWDSAVAKNLENIPTKVVIPKEMGVEKKGLLPAVNGSGQAGTPISVIPGNDKQDLRVSVLEDKLNRANSMLSQLLVRVTTPQPQTNNCMPSCSRNDAPSYDEIEKLRPIFLPNCGKPKETLNEREPLKMTIKRPNGGSLLTVQLNSNSNAPDKPVRDPSCESPLKIAKKLSDVDAGKMPKLNETLSFLERRSTEYFEKRMREGHSKEKTTSLACTICSEEVHIHKNTLTNHLYKHTKAPLFKCSYCEFTNNHSHLIIQHTRVAHPDKPPYEFTDRTSLFDMELSEIAFKAFFDFKKFANLDKQ